MTRRSYIQARNILRVFFPPERVDARLSRDDLLRALGKDRADAASLNALYGKLSTLRSYDLIDTVKDPAARNRLTAITLTTRGQQALHLDDRPPRLTEERPLQVSLESVCADILTLSQQMPHFTIRLQVEPKDKRTKVR